MAPRPDPTHTTSTHNTCMFARLLACSLACARTHAQAGVHGNMYACMRTCAERVHVRVRGVHACVRVLRALRCVHCVALRCVALRVCRRTRVLYTIMCTCACTCMCVRACGRAGGRARVGAGGRGRARECWRACVHACVCAWYMMAKVLCVVFVTRGHCGRTAGRQSQRTSRKTAAPGYIIIANFYYS